MIFIGANTTPVSLPVTLANGTTADADQVMADFNALKNYVNANSNGIYTTTGTPSAQILTYVAAPLALSTGSAFLFIVGDSLTNTGPTTLNVNGTGAKNLTINRVHLSGGELAVGMVVLVVYDGTEYQIVGLSGSASAATASSNVIINPSMEIDQEYEGASVGVASASPIYIIDGWVASLVAGAVVTAQRIADAPPGFTNSLELVIVTGAAAGVNDFVTLSQLIEANNITNWAVGTSSAKNLILSFWVKCSIGDYIMSVALQNAAGTRSYTDGVYVASSGVWEQKFVSIPLDTAGGWVTAGASAGAHLSFTFSAGITFETPANVWATGDFITAPLINNTFLATNGANVRITGVSLSVGNAPNTFMRRTISEEIAVCQRYYEKSYNYGVALGTAESGGTCSVTFAGSATDANIGGTAFFKTNKRAVPTVTIYDGAGDTGVISSYAVSWTDGGTIAGTPAASEIGVFVQANIVSATLINFEFVADARL